MISNAVHLKKAKGSERNRYNDKTVRIDKEKRIKS